MAYNPIFTGGVIVEVPKAEYEKLVRCAEKVAAVERYIARSSYPNTSEIEAILDIDGKGIEE